MPSHNKNPNLASMTQSWETRICILELNVLYNETTYLSKHSTRCTVLSIFYITVVSTDQSYACF